METPLLSEAPSTSDGDYPPARNVTEIKSVFWTETAKLWKIAVPVVLNALCRFGVTFFTTIFAGHLGEIELSAVTISLTVIGSFSAGFLFGMGSALETLCGQAFGAGQVHMLGIYLQRSWIISFVSCIALLPIYIFTTPILKLLGQDDNIAKVSGEFAIETIPQLFSLAFTLPTQKFLQAQRKLGVITWIGFVALIINLLLLWLFIYAFGWGMTGAAIAYDLTSWGIAVAQVIYVIGWRNDGWRGLSWSAFKDIWAFVRLSLSSAVMICLEVWYGISIVLLAGHLHNAVIAVGSLSISTNYAALEAMFFVGMSAAVSVRVSNELGLGHARTAKYCVYVATFQSLVIGLFCMVVILLTKDYFAIIFTSSKELQLAASKLAFILGIAMVLTSVQQAISGAAVGGGWQALVAYINVGCFYVFGLPLGLLLGYKEKLGVMGLWGGMLVGLGLQTLLLVFVLFRTNWNKEVEQLTERIQKWGGKEINAENVAEGGRNRSLESL